MNERRKKKLKKAGYTAVQWSWGLPQTVLGAALYLKHRNDEHFDYRGAKATVWNGDAGVSLGKFIFVPKNAGTDPSEFLLNHEYGHTIQSLILGPLYLPLIGAPSFAWNRLAFFERRRKKSGKSYYSAIFERTANSLGTRVSGKGRHRHRKTVK